MGVDPLTISAVDGRVYHAEVSGKGKLVIVKLAKRGEPFATKRDRRGVALVVYQQREKTHGCAVLTIEKDGTLKNRGTIGTPDIYVSDFDLGLIADIQPVNETIVSFENLKEFIDLLLILGHLKPCSRGIFWLKDSS